MSGAGPILALLSLSTGIYVESVLRFGWPLAGMSFLLGLSVFFSIYFFHHSTSWSKFILIALVCFSFGAARFDLKDFRTGDSVLDNFEDVRLRINGVVVSEPDERENDTRIVLRANEFVANEKSYQTNEKIFVVLNKYPKLFYGDQIRFTGVVHAPKNFAAEDGGTAFDWVGYLSMNDIYFESRHPSDIEKTGVHWSFTRGLLLVKHSMLGVLGHVLPEPTSSLAGGLLLGAKQSLGEEWLARFRVAGVSHLVVLSGYNIAIIADAIRSMFSFLPRAFSTAFGVFGVIAFTLMSGAGASTIRAALMALIAMLGRTLGRPYDAARALFVAASVMLLWNPKILLYDTGFQLSFLATAGLIYLSPILESRFSRVPRWRWLDLRGLLSMTIAAQLAVLPWLLYKMGTISIIGLLVNILILPIVPLTMFLSFITICLGYVGHIVTVPVSVVTSWLLRYILAVTKSASSIRFASLEVGHTSVVLIVIFYVCLVFYIRKQHKKVPQSASEKEEMNMVH